MTVFTVTTMRGFCPWDFSGYPNLLRYLKMIGEQESYKRAMQKGDPQIEPMLGPTVEPFVFGKR